MSCIFSDGSSAKPLSVCEMYEEQVRQHEIEMKELEQGILECTWVSYPEAPGHKNRLARGTFKMVKPLKPLIAIDLKIKPLKLYPKMTNML